MTVRWSLSVVRARRLSAVAGLAAAAALYVAAGASAGVVPGQGQLIEAKEKISGRCTAITPPYPDSTEWGPEQDGTPFRATSIDSSFVQLPLSAPFDPYGSIDFSYSEPDQRCEFADGATEDTLPLETGSPGPGVWKMFVVKQTYDETYDSVTGWIPQADDGHREVIEEATFETTAKNPCDSPWQGIGPTAPYCLKKKPKQEAAANAKIERKLEIKTGQRPTGFFALMGAPSQRDPNVVYQRVAGQVNFHIGALMDEKIAHDPPDKHYRSIAKPKPPRVRGLAKLLPAAPYTQMLRALDRALGYEQALVTSINRANGAFAATLKEPSADKWTLEQDVAASNDVGDAIDQIDYAARDLGRVRHNLAAAGALKGAGAKLISLWSSSLHDQVRQLKAMDYAFGSQRLLE